MLEETDIRFRDADEVMRIIDRIVAPLGRRVDESSPMVDARLPDGSRVNVIIPPLSLVGPCISIRKFARAALTAEDDLMRLGTVTKDMADFLRACVLARLNIVISGGTSTGKTTLLNILSTLHPRQRAHRHHRGRRRAAAAAAARRPPGGAAAQRGGQGRRSPSANW